MSSGFVPFIGHPQQRFLRLSGCPSLVLACGRVPTRSRPAMGSPFSRSLIPPSGITELSARRRRGAEDCRNVPRSKRIVVPQPHSRELKSFGAQSLGGQEDRRPETLHCSPLFLRTLARVAVLAVPNAGSRKAFLRRGLEKPIRRARSWEHMQRAGSRG